jgi:hypothetical protein
MRIESAMLEGLSFPFERKRTNQNHYELETMLLLTQQPDDVATIASVEAEITFTIHSELELWVRFFLGKDNQTMDYDIQSPLVKKVTVAVGRNEIWDSTPSYWQFDKLMRDKLDELADLPHSIWDIASTATQESQRKLGRLE